MTCFPVATVDELEITPGSSLMGIDPYIGGGGGIKATSLPEVGEVAVLGGILWNVPFVKPFLTEREAVKNVSY